MENVDYNTESLELLSRMNDSYALYNMLRVDILIVNNEIPSTADAVKAMRTSKYADEEEPSSIIFVKIIKEPAPNILKKA